jgi:hypothetical protein
LKSHHVRQIVVAAYAASASLLAMLATGCSSGSTTGGSTGSNGGAGADDSGASTADGGGTPSDAGENGDVVTSPEAGHPGADACPGLGCGPSCPNGVLKDSNGCDTCTCAPAAEAGSGGACQTDSDCGDGGACGYLESAMCSAVGSCFVKTGGVACLLYEPGCTCSGSEVDLACNGLPSGYAPGPLRHSGACGTDGG